MTIITGTTRNILLIGHPVAQVRSPPVINRYLDETHANTVMIPADIAPDAIDHFFALLHSFGNCAGVSVTLPHKQAALRAVATASARARRIGAVNIIRREADGALAGDMTDGLAFVEAMRRGGREPAGRRAVLAGAAGGAGAAIADALCETGVAALALVDIDAGRTAARAAILRDAYPAVGIVEGWPESFAADLAVNASPMGMSPGDPVPVDLDRLAPGALVADVVTKPNMTPLLVEASRRGHPIQTGNDMADAQLEPQMRHLGLWREEAGAPRLEARS